MTIRKATSRETQKILDYSLEVLKEATMGHVKPDKEKASEMVSPFLDAGGFYLVHVENNEVQGWIGVGRTMDYHTDEMIGVLPEVYVYPQYRKRGIAEKLCNEAFRHLQEEGVNRVQLYVFEGNISKHLCQKLGFQEIVTLMEKQLDNHF
ncbi:GNAT family N-acetyltransferase [Siminovitchia fortis]|uniref:GNAT family N-acetyltransferase n=1 Tax=Siminovitchia fortis TaxID=254758 RepID=A0A443IMB8_9BACI|nr:GNAT family N-acetyltransferase [Siminovitchia fortis]RWR06514.1 GNAT family N-acetyltransferase [Siminovitchia fortis]WHY80859.1 GNAT family N-acetyltransferase [Siminovitchia fortis]